MVWGCAHLVASIAKGMMQLVAARRKLHLDVHRENRSSHGRCERVHGVVSMTALSKARLAQIEILANRAVKELTGRQFYIFC